MRVFLSSVAAVALLAVSTAFLLVRADDRLAQPAPTFLPGSFQTLSVSGPRPDHYYCPVCESGLNPGVLILFAKVEEASKPLPTLLKQIDEVLARYPEARMNACAICLDDGGYRHAVGTDTEPPELKTLDAALARKEGIQSRLKELTQALGLKNVVFGLGMDPEGLKEYHVAPDAYATVLVYNRQHVIGTFSFPQATLDDSRSVAALKLIDSTAAAAQKQAQPTHRKPR